ncbi:MAG: histidine kinase [Bacteroidales bacterium]|nr:histidine kinase [Bacteroidales bacterium]
MHTPLIYICFAAVTILLTTFVGITIYLYIKNRSITRRNLQVEQQLLLSQMNPHFVFNSLTAIQSYIFRNEAHLASKYLASFAKLIRLVLENSRIEFNTVEREVNTLRYYLELQSLRFEERFEYHIEVENQAEINSAQIPPMLTQPFIENAIEHGFLHNSSKGVLSIRFIPDHGKTLTIEVEDNGIGIEKSRQMQIQAGKTHQSLATEITRERIRKIRKSKGFTIDMSITDLGLTDSSKHGTLVKFQIPLQPCSPQ